MAIVPIALPSLLPRAMMANWKTEVILESAYLTSVSVADTLAEDRRSLIRNPYRTQFINLSGLSRQESAQIQAHFLRTSDERIPVPLYCDFAGVTSATGVDIFCDPSLRRFFPGGRILIHEIHLVHHFLHHLQLFLVMD